MPGEGASLAFWLERLLSRSWCKLSQSFFLHLHVVPFGARLFSMEALATVLYLKKRGAGVVRCMVAPS